LAPKENQSKNERYIWAKMVEEGETEGKAEREK